MIKKVFLYFWSKKSNISIFVFLSFIFLTLWLSRYFLRAGSFYSHDLDFNLIRSLEAYLSLKEGHFPLRWAGDLNYGCGVPVFNFFYPLVYYLMSFIFVFLGDFLLSWKILVFISLFIGSWFFYLWIKNETKDNIASFGGALIYLLAPYRFSLVFVRGSVEFLAYAILPIVFFLVSKVLSEKKRYPLKTGFLLSLVLVFYFLSHNIVVLITFPVLLFYVLLNLFKEKRNNSFFALFSIISGLFMSSFFWGPAILEKKYVRLSVDNVVVNYWEHFPTLTQLLRSKWGYFYSVPGSEDEMSFMLGYAQWTLVLFSFLFIIYYLFKFRVDPNVFLRKNFWFVFYFTLSIFSIFLMLPISSFIWENVRLLQQVQFPWRILGLTVFLVSCLFSYFLIFVKDNFNNKIFYFIFLLIVFLGLWGNRNHLRVFPSDLQDYKTFKNNSLRYSTTSMANEILPYGSLATCNLEEPFSSEGKVSDLRRGLTYGSFKISFDGLQSDKVLLHLGYFPGLYKFVVNGRENVPYSDCEGRVCISSDEFAPFGFVSWKVAQTPTQKLFNAISVFSLLMWFIFIFGLFRKKYLWLFLLLVFLFFRMYGLDKRIAFGWDQERDAFAVSEILKGKLTLIGPRVIGPNGFFLPPYFFYILSPFYFVGKGDPRVSLLFFLFSYWVLFFVLSYKFISKSVGKNESVLFILIWSVLPLAIGIDRIAWNPIFIPLIFIILLFAHYKYYSTGNLHWFLVLCLSYFFGASFHIQGLFYFPFLLTAFIVNKEVFLKKLVLLVFSAFLVFLPILLFDLRHNFLNFSLIFNFSQNLLVKGGLLDVWSNFVSMFVGLRFEKAAAFVFYLIFVILNLFLLIRINVGYKKHLSYSLFLILLLFPVVFYFYGFRPSEYYFNFLVPVFVLIFSIFIPLVKSALSRLLLIFFLVAFIFWSAKLNLKNSVYYDGESLYFKERVVYFIKEITQNRNYNLSIDSKKGKDAGFYYLLKFYGLEYNKDNTFPLIRIVEPPDSNCFIRFGDYSLCFLPEDFGW